MRGLVIVSCILIAVVLIIFTTKKTHFFCKFDNPFYNDKMFDNLNFSEIKMSHYLPALEDGIKDAQKEIDAIVNNTEEPTFENVIIPLEYGSQLLNRVASVFYNLSSAIATEESQKLEEQITDRLSKFENEVNFNKKLFEKIKKVYDKKDSLNLSPEALRVLELRYLGYVHSGINLEEGIQAQIKDINNRLATLNTNFSNNLLDEARERMIIITDKSRLSGLSESSITAFKKAAEEKNKQGYLISIAKPDIMDVLTNADDRDLRKQAMDLYTSKGKKNIPIVLETINLRIRRANLMGYPNHASYVLSYGTMAKTPERALNLMEQVWTKALAKAKVERDELQKLAQKELNDPKFKLEAWDWFYWAEKLKKKEYSLDQNELKPYFELSAVRQGLFTVLNKLYDLEFVRINKSVYHPDVEVYRVQDSKTKELKGELYLDYFAREGKNAGAWMNDFRSQHIDLKGNDVRPIVINVFNFQKTANGEPVLLTTDDVETLFHEVGHSTHSLLSKCHYPSVAGTATATDFVEFPSQISERWAFHRDVLPLYAKHYQTGEIIPDELITKIEKASKYGYGFSKTEFLSAALLDMRWHLLTTEFNNLDVTQFENEVLNSYQLIPEIIVRYKTPYFLHLFAHGYDAKYYAYLWSDMLVADAFSLFKEKGVFNREVSDSFKNNVLSRGNTEDPSILYKRFRGKDPDTDAMMKDWGFDK